MSSEYAKSTQAYPAFLNLDCSAALRKSKMQGMLGVTWSFAEISREAQTMQNRMQKIKKVTLSTITRMRLERILTRTF